MRIYGCIQTKFWTLPEVQKLSDQAKLLGAYLNSSTHTTMLGCFRVPVGYIADDLKWNIDVVVSAMAELSSINYLTYDTESSYVFIHDFLNHNPIENPNQGRSIEKIFHEAPQNLSFITPLITVLFEHGEFLREDFLNRLETLSQPFRNQDQNQEQYQDQKQNQECIMSGKPDVTQLKDSFFENQKAKTPRQERQELKSQALEVLNFLNEKTGRGYRAGKSHINLIMARLSSGVTVGQCFQVIAKKFRDWHEDEKMKMYLRPETLFNVKKFESYLGEVSVTATQEPCNE